VRLVLTFALCARYLMFIGEDAKRDLELPILDELEHISTIRAAFGGTTEV
jgi:hypothetical protein